MQDLKPAAPAPIGRTPFDRWCWERGLELKEIGEAIGCSHEHVRAIRKPFGHPDRRVPSSRVMATIVEWTGGEIKPADFYPPELSADAA